MFHRLSLSSIKSGKGAPVWLEDRRVSAVASSSINRTTVDMNSGEMGFSIFEYNEIYERIFKNEKLSNFEKLVSLSESIGDNSLPIYLLSFIKTFMPYGDKSIGLHGVRTTEKYAEALDRLKGVFGGKGDYDKFPEASHHLLIYKNNVGKARIIYAYRGSIKTLKNRGRRND